MMNSAKLYLLAKIAFAVLLSVILFWTDLAGIPSEMTLQWVPITVPIVLLALTLIAKMRKPIVTLLFVSKHNSGYGLLLLSGSMATYLAKSYLSTAFSTALFAFAFSFFVASLTAFLLDYRIVREFFVLFVTLPFTLPPTEIAINQETEFSLTSYLFGLLAVFALSIFASKTLLQKQDATCSFCGSRADSEVECVFCGKQPFTHSFKLRKADMAKFSALALLMVITVFSVVPVSSMSGSGGFVEKYAWTGVGSESILDAPTGWVLSNSTRLVSYENETNEDFALLEVYHSANSTASLLLEIGPQEPYFMNIWQLPDWNREKFTENIFITEQVRGKSYVLRRASETIVVLRSSTMTYLFRENSEFSDKKAGISVFMNFSHSLNGTEVAQTLEPLTFIAAAAVNRLVYLQYWTERVYVLTQIYALTLNMFLSAGAVVVLVSIAWFARRQDYKVGKQLDRLANLDSQGKDLLYAALDFHRRKFSGQQLFQKLSQRGGENADSTRFSMTLRQLEAKGFLKRDLTIRDADLLSVWSLAF